MDRRDFMKLAGCAGMCVAASPVLGRGDFGLAPYGLREGYEGPLFVMLQAHGGWDPTLFCDPKANLNNSYGESDIGTAGNIAYAPVPGAGDLFGAHYQRTMVVNAVDTATNSHEAGQRHTASGRLGEGHPNLGALLAGAAAPQLPMAFITFGGYERTGGVVAPVRNGNQTRLSELSYPDRIDAADPASSTYHAPATHTMIRMAREARTEAMIEAQRLPRFDHAMSSLMTARLGSDQLKRLQEVLPTPDANALNRQAQLIVAAYKAGICVAGNMTHDGFDTHGDHDAQHRARMSELIAGLSFLWNEAERQGVADRLVVLVKSDFGRTPQYNGNLGKDHWSITSMVLMGAGVPGNRVVGISDSGHSPVPLDPATLQPAADAAQGVRVQPVHVHKALRTILGIEGSELDARFPLVVDDELDLLA